LSNKPEIREIAPGVRLCSVQTDRFKTGAVSFSMALPLEGDMAANAALPFILHRSCRRYPEFSALNGRLDELYGASLSAGVAKIGESQALTISLTAIDDRFSLAGESVAQNCADLLADLLFDPDLPESVFHEKAVEREKRLLIEKMKSERKDKRVYALQRCEELMCAGEKYALNKYSTREDIESLTGERLYTAWRRALETSLIQAVSVSSGTSAGIAETFGKAFSEIRRSPVRPATAFIKSAKETRKAEEKLPVKQGKLVLGFRAGMDNPLDGTAAARVMTDIYGGGTYSKLFMKVREELSLCYYCSARLNNHKGLLMVQSGIESEKAAEAEAEILRQLDAVKKGDILANEFDASLMSICDHRLSIEDSPAELNSWYTAQIFREDIMTPMEDAADIRAVTLDEVVSRAEKVTLDTVYLLSGNGEAHEDED